MTENSTTNAHSETGMKPKEIPVIYDQGFFQHATGDTYDGAFEAKKKDRSAKMHGIGTYTTAEGDVYFGNWEGDKLGNRQEDIEITYINGAKYTGKLKDWCYSHRSSYKYVDESVLTCEFVDNIPSGKLELRDPNGHIWIGRAGVGYGWMSPINHYYDMLEVAPLEVVKKKKGKK